MTTFRVREIFKIFTLKSFIRGYTEWPESPLLLFFNDNKKVTTEIQKILLQYIQKHKQG